MPDVQCYVAGSFLLPEAVRGGIVPWWFWLILVCLIGLTVRFRRSYWGLLSGVVFIGLICFGFAGQIRDGYRVTKAAWTVTAAQKQLIHDYQVVSHRERSSELARSPIYVSSLEGDRIKAMKVADYGCAQGLLVEADESLLGDVSDTSDANLLEYVRHTRMTPREREVEGKWSLERWHRSHKMINSDIPRSLSIPFAFEWCRPLEGRWHYCEGSAYRIAMTNGTRY